MNSVYKYSGESLTDVVVREYGTAEALILVAIENGLRFDDAAAATVQLPDFTPEKPRPAPIPIKREIEQVLTVDSGQVFTDISIQHYGSVELMVELFARFGELVSTSAGQQLTMPVLAVSDKQALAFFRGKRKVAAQSPPVAVGSDMAIISTGDYYIKSNSNNQLRDGFIKFR